MVDKNKASYRWKFFLAAMGSKPDRSGRPGVDQVTIDKFFEATAATVAWLDQADRDPAIRPLGSTTPEAAEAVAVVRAKLDDYFARCRLAAFDSRAVAALSPAESDLTALAGKSLTPFWPPFWGWACGCQWACCLAVHGWRLRSQSLHHGCRSD